MEFPIYSGDLATQKTACLILGVFENRKLSAPAEAIDQASGGHLTRILRRGDLSGEAERALLLYDVPGVQGTRVLLVGCGKRKEYHRGAYLKALATAVGHLDGHAITEALCTLPNSAPKNLETYLCVRDAVLVALDKSYRYTATRSVTAKVPKKSLGQLGFWVSGQAEKVTAETAVRHGQAMARGIAWAKDLGNRPGNLCTPTYLADQALALAREFPTLQVEILEEEEMARLGMGALLSVARGSRQPAKLILLHHLGGAPEAKPLVLVGKGLTFDAGGLSLKPAQDMDEMKYDMSGGACVFGALRAALELQLPINLIGVVPASENLPDGDANKPGDVVTSLSGQTIEILNTDAEGRLILCDALTYCERFSPAAVVDLATLTGACAVALGAHASGLFTQDEALAGKLLEAGDKAHDRAWRLPLWDDYQEQIDSRFADLANVGGKYAGAITAACFLARFTKKYPWAHLDIAGTAWISGKDNKGSTGRPVALLVQFLLEHARA